jgi:16S rRNA (guanine527-N7)-methyltransferase
LAPGLRARPTGPPPDREAALAELELLLRDDPLAPIAKSTRPRARQVHIADSLAGLELGEISSAESIADLGSGAGLPGLVIAAALPEARVDLIESTTRKASFIERAAERMGLRNTAVIGERAEAWAAGAGRERYGAVTARAVGRLSTLAELASPLLCGGGFLVAWKGGRDRDEEAELDRALARLAMERDRVVPVTPYPGSRGRHIHLLRKNGPTPNDLPRRDGLAAKRPFGSE